MKFGKTSFVFLGSTEDRTQNVVRAKQVLYPELHPQPRTAYYKFLNPTLYVHPVSGGGGCVN